jgi:hypothetical protein
MGSVNARQRSADPQRIPGSTAGRRECGLADPMIAPPSGESSSDFSKGFLRQPGGCTKPASHPHGVLIGRAWGPKKFLHRPISQSRLADLMSKRRRLEATRPEMAFTYPAGLCSRDVELTRPKGASHAIPSRRRHQGRHSRSRREADRPLEVPGNLCRPVARRTPPPQSD